MVSNQQPFAQPFEKQDLTYVYALPLLSSHKLVIHVPRFIINKLYLCVDTNFKIDGSVPSYSAFFTSDNVQLLTDVLTGPQSQ